MGKTYRGNGVLVMHAEAEGDDLDAAAYVGPDPAPLVAGAAGVTRITASGIGIVAFEWQALGETRGRAVASVKRAVQQAIADATADDQRLAVDHLLVRAD